MRLSAYLTLAVVVLIFTQCDNSGDTTASTASLDEFDMVEIPGPLTKAIRKTENGLLAEEGYLIEGKRNGMWIKYHSDGRISNIQHYADDQLNGVAITLDNRGQITEKIHYTRDAYDGLKATYRFGRAQEEIPYKMGVIDGRVKRYYTNGKLMEEIDYVNGEQDGIYRHYSEKGDMDLDYLYENGEKVSGGIVTEQDSQQMQ